MHDGPYLSEITSASPFFEGFFRLRSDRIETGIHPSCLPVNGQPYLLSLMTDDTRMMVGDGPNIAIVVKRLDTELW